MLEGCQHLLDSIGPRVELQAGRQAGRTVTHSIKLRLSRGKDQTAQLLGLHLGIPQHLAFKEAVCQGHSNKLKGTHLPPAALPWLCWHTAL